MERRSFCFALTLRGLARSGLAQRGRIGAPSASEQEAFLKAARQAALGYADRLPNFLCTETIERFRVPESVTGFHVDTLTVEVGYYEHEEHYHLTEVNGRPANSNYADLRGAISRGEFGSNLRTIFDPASQVRFRFARWATLGGCPAAVYSFRVERSNADYPITARQGGKDMTAQVGLRGEAVMDRKTHAVLRLNYKADGVPDDFPIRSSDVTIDYGETEIGGSHYRLPVKATVEFREEGGTSRNEVTFHSYRKFSAESSIQFDTEAGGPRR